MTGNTTFTGVSSARHAWARRQAEVTVSETLESLLRDAGFQVLATRDGEDALGMVEDETSPIVAVLAEAHMPGVGGHEIAAVLEEYRPDVPVVLVSSVPASAHAGVLRDSYPIHRALDVRDTAELLRKLRATIERVGQIREQIRTSNRSRIGASRSLKAKQSILIRDARALIGSRAPPACPGCQSPRVAAILYGGERVNRLDELASGKVVLGGAQRAAADPAWYCRDCEHRW